MAQNLRKRETPDEETMAATEKALHTLPFPNLAGEQDIPPDLRWWQRWGLKAGTLEMVAQQNPRLNPTVLALCSLILVFVGLLCGGAIQYGRLLTQVDTLQSDVATLKAKQPEVTQLQADKTKLQQDVRDLANDVKVLKMALKLQ